MSSAASVRREQASEPGKFAAWLKGLPPGLWMLLLLVLIYGTLSSTFLTWPNITSVVRQAVPLMILAFGQTLIVLTQGTDLSLGMQASFVTVTWVTLATLGLNIYVAAALAVLSTVLIGSVNGLLVAKGKIPPFIATFGMQNIVMSASLLITGGASIYFYHPVFEFVMESRIWFLPTPVFIAALAFTLTWVLLYRTQFGTNIFGLGGNQEALSLAGVSITRAYVKTYAYVGFLAGVCGLVTACRVESGQPIVGMGWEFEAVAATLLGGTSLREGRGGVAGTILGVLLLAVLRNGLNHVGVSAIYQNAIIGTVVMLAIVTDALIRRYRD